MWPGSNKIRDFGNAGGEKKQISKKFGICRDCAFVALILDVAQG
jgi:hypothetical protein